LRGPGNIALAVVSVVISAVLVARGHWSRRGIAGKLLVLLWGLAPLSMLGAHLTFEVRKRDVAEEFGRIQGRELASLGVTVNFAPVLDLRSETKRTRFDFNTLIGQRAI